MNKIIISIKLAIKKGDLNQSPFKFFNMNNYFFSVSRSISGTFFRSSR